MLDHWSPEPVLRLVAVVVDLLKRVENEVKLFAHVFGKEPQHEVAVLLQQEVFAAITAVFGASAVRL